MLIIMFYIGDILTLEGTTITIFQNLEILQIKKIMHTALIELLGWLHSRET